MQGLPALSGVSMYMEYIGIFSTWNLYFLPFEDWEKGI